MLPEYYWYIESFVTFARFVRKVQEYVLLLLVRIVIIVKWFR